MIEKLPFTEIHTGDKDMVDLVEFRPVAPYEMQHKINELVDAVNGILDYAPLEMAMKAEPKTELERTRKALNYAIGVIQTVAKMSDKLSREYGDTLVEQLDNIQAYCWQEGYALTHEEDLERAITALEQKDVK